jgi:urease accessory protein
VRAAAHVVAERGPGGATLLAAVRSQAPLVLRRTPGALLLVGAAGGPLGGDELRLSVEVGEGATLTMGSVAATIAQPGPTPGASLLHVELRVAAGGTLHWLPEPTVVAAGAVHRVVTEVTLALGAALRWREEVVLGRLGEAPGSYEADLRVAYAGRPLLAQAASWGPRAPAGWDGPAVLGDARVAGALLEVDPAWDGAPPEGPAPDGPVTVLPLAGPGLLVQALAGDALTLRRALDRAARPSSNTVLPSVDP